MLYHKLIEVNLNRKNDALFDESNGWSIGKIHERTAQYCAVFQNMGLKMGDRILVMEQSSVEMVVILLACIAKGYIFVPFHAAADRETRAQIVCDCSPQLVLDDTNMEVFAEQAKQQCRADAVHQMTLRSKLGIETLVYILYTSGSDGRPKGVVSSQKQILFCSNAINERLQNRETDRILCCLPLSFDYGLYQVFLGLLSGAQVYLAGGDVLQRIPFYIDRWKITAFPTIPTMMNLLIKTGLFAEMRHSKLRYITFTGEVLPVSLICRLKQCCPGVRIVPMYGMTECKRVAVMPEGRDDKTAEGSCGLPLKDVHVWLQNQDVDTGIGELVVMGDNVMEGYWNAKDAQEGVFSTDIQNGQRILCTGDLFRIDEDGFLYFCGRKNGIIKIKGYRVNGFAIEKRLKTIEEVIEAAVVAEEDILTGERACIWIYSESAAIYEQVKKCMQQYPAYMQNYRLWIQQQPLPKNKNGKIAYSMLKEMERNEG